MSAFARDALRAFFQDEDDEDDEEGDEEDDEEVADEAII